MQQRRGYDTLSLVNVDLQHPDSQAPPEPRLEYAARPRLMKRRAGRRIVLALAMLCAIVLALKLGPRLWYRARLVYWQNRCLAYHPPAGQVALELTSQQRGNLSTTQFIPPEWQQFYRLLSPPGAASSGTAFVGAVETPEGRRRLVAVDSSVSQGSYWNSEMADLAGSTVDLDARMIDPGTWLRPPVEMNLTVIRKNAHVEVQESGRFLAGRIDPKDPTHFVIPYTVDGRDGAIDGWVTGDNTIVLEDATP